MHPLFIMIPYLGRFVVSFVLYLLLFLLPIPFDLVADAVPLVVIPAEASRAEMMTAVEVLVEVPEDIGYHTDL